MSPCVAITCTSPFNSFNLSLITENHSLIKLIWEEGYDHHQSMYVQCFIPSNTPYVPPASDPTGATAK